MDLLSFLVNVSKDILSNVSSDDKSTRVEIEFSPQVNQKYGGDISNATLYLNEEQKVAKIIFVGNDLSSLRNKINQTKNFESIPCHQELYEMYYLPQRLSYDCLNKDSSNNHNRIRMSDESKELIQNIALNLQNHPHYLACEIKLNRRSLANDTYEIDIYKFGKQINKFIFYPAINYSGKIGSLAIYGSFLNEYLYAIRSAGSIFGIKIESITRDAGFEDYLDIYLDY